MKIKICGLTRHEDVERCVELGATHLGFVIEPNTPRHVTPAQAGELAASLPKDRTPVLVARSTKHIDVREAMSSSEVCTLQLHSFDEEEASALEADGLRVHRVHSASDSTGSLVRFDPPPALDRLRQSPNSTC